jgi:hypothetical protein
MVRIYICINVVSAKLNADGQPYPPTTAQPTAIHGILLGHGTRSPDLSSTMRIKCRYTMKR